MRLSLFILGLFVFLQAGVLLTWFTVDPKLEGIVGMAFVIVLIVEVVLGAMGHRYYFGDKPA